MSSIRRLANETLLYGISSIVGRFLYFALTPLYTGLFLPSEYGVVTHLFSFIGFGMLLYTYRIEVAYFRFATETQEEESSIFTNATAAVLGSSLLLSVLLFVLSPTLANWFGYSSRTYLVQLSVCILALDALTELPFARLRLFAKAKIFAGIRLINILTNIGSNLFFLVFCPYALSEEAWSFLHPLLQLIYYPELGIAYIFISNLIASLVALLLLMPQYRGFSMRKLSSATWKRMTVYALPLMLVGFSYIVNELFDRQALPLLSSGTEEEKQYQLGIYGANYKLAMLLSLFTQAFRYGAEPFFFKFKTKDNAAQIYATIAKYFSIINVLGFLGIVFYIDIFKYFISNPEYWIGLNVVPILLIANLFLGMYYNFSAWYKLADKTKIGAFISLFGAIITIVLNIWWIPKFGYHGSAWATLICYFSIMVVCYCTGKKYYPIPYDVRRMLFYFSLALLLYGMTILLKKFSSLELAGILMCNSLFLFVFLTIVYKQEKKELLTLFTKQEK